MAGVLNVMNLEQLNPFKNEKGIIEIAIRSKKKRFEAFQKITISNLKQGSAQKSMVDNALNLLNKNNSMLKNSINMMNKVANLQQLSVILNGVNLCATCVGFVIMNAKLDKISSQIKEMMSVVKQGNEVQIDYEFKKVLSEYSNMLDSKRRQKPYAEEQMRKLVDDEYNVLNMLIDVFSRNLTEGTDNLLISIFSLAAMLGVTLRYFDELYYFNNKEALGDGDKWHSSHENWMSVFEKLTDKEFIKRIQDHAILDLDLSTVDADIYYLSLNDQIMEMVESIRDNQYLIEKLDSQELMKVFEEGIKKEVADEIQKAFDETEGAMEDPKTVKAYQLAMKQVGIT